MTLAVRAVFWVIAYLGAVLSPLVFAVIGASQPDHGFWTDFSVALGFVGLAMMGLECARGSLSAAGGAVRPGRALAVPPPDRLRRVGLHPHSLRHLGEV